MDTFVISLGGSLIVPDQIDWEFLKKFKRLIEKFVSRGFRFVIITGGGKTSRRYQDAAGKIAKLHREDIDWIGIHATRINAHLLRTIFRSKAHPRIIKTPTGKISFQEPILIAAGWKPGFSTDMDAVLIARRIGAKTVINLSNIDYAYDKDPKKHADAKKIKRISWGDFRKIVGDKWNPGLNTPFDPVASKEASRSSISVIIANGQKLKNLENILLGKKFEGTVIR